MRRRGDVEVFSLSFLDCICCGFGALILLLVLTKNAEPVIFEDVSLYNPVAWRWEFSPNLVTYLNGTYKRSQNPEVSLSDRLQ